MQTYLPDKLVLPSDLGVVVLCVDDILIVLIDLAMVILDGVGNESHSEGRGRESFGKGFLLVERKRSESRGFCSESSCGSSKEHAEKEEVWKG